MTMIRVCYITWKTWRTRKSKGISYLTWKSGKSKGIGKNCKAWSNFHANFKTKLLSILSYIGTLNGLFSLFSSLKVKLQSMSSVWFNNTLKSNTIRCTATIVSGRKYIAWSFVRLKWVSMSAQITATYVAVAFQYSCLPVCFHLMKGRAMYFRPETIVASFLHLMVLLFKMLLNHTSKCQFMVYYCQMSSVIETFYYFQVIQIL